MAYGCWVIACFKRSISLARGLFGLVYVGKEKKEEPCPLLFAPSHLPCFSIVFEKSTGEPTVGTIRQTYRFPVSVTHSVSNS